MQRQEINSFPAYFSLSSRIAARGRRGLLRMTVRLGRYGNAGAGAGPLTVTRQLRRKGRRRPCDSFPTPRSGFPVASIIASRTTTRAELGPDGHRPLQIDEPRRRHAKNWRSRARTSAQKRDYFARQRGGLHLSGGRAGIKRPAASATRSFRVPSPGGAAGSRSCARPLRYTWHVATTAAAAAGDLGAS